MIANIIVQSALLDLSRMQIVQDALHLQLEDFKNFPVLRQISGPIENLFDYVSITYVFSFNYAFFNKN